MKSEEKKCMCQRRHILTKLFSFFACSPLPAFYLQLLFTAWHVSCHTFLCTCVSPFPTPDTPRGLFMIYSFHIQLCRITCKSTRIVPFHSLQKCIIAPGMDVHGFAAILPWMDSHSIAYFFLLFIYLHYKSSQMFLQLYIFSTHISLC